MCEWCVKGVCVGVCDQHTFCLGSKDGSLRSALQGQRCEFGAAGTALSSVRTALYVHCCSDATLGTLRLYRKCESAGSDKAPLGRENGAASHGIKGR